MFVDEIGTTERFLLNALYFSNKPIAFDEIAKSYHPFVSFELTRWVVAVTQEYQWKADLRKSMHRLRTAGLVKGDDFSPWDITLEGSALVESIIKEPIAGLRPDRKDTIVSRIDRDTSLAESIKERYAGRCQVCGLQIYVGAERYYSEAHHLIPLGKPYDGPDAEENLIVLCPNHHTMFDYSVMAIHPTNSTIVCIDEQGKVSMCSDSLKISLHNINPICVEHHYTRFLEKVKA